jgi:hypothetical protein
MAGLNTLERMLADPKVIRVFAAEELDADDMGVNYALSMIAETVSTMSIVIIDMAPDNRDRLLTISDSEALSSMRRKVSRLSESLQSQPDICAAKASINAASWRGGRYLVHARSGDVERILSRGWFREANTITERGCEMPMFHAIGRMLDPTNKRGGN